MTEEQLKKKIQNLRSCRKRRIRMKLEIKNYSKLVGKATSDDNGRKRKPSFSGNGK